jgi:UDP-N-acetylglucosamine 2-epimerase (non-hydrolysing)
VKSPWPEEFNRRTIGTLASLHFAPTARARHNLIAENVPDDSIEVTGNTAVDAVRFIADQPADFPGLRKLFDGRKMILVTAHRRENFGLPLQQILGAIRQFATENPDFQIVYPVHPNPNISRFTRTSYSQIFQMFL